MLFSHILQTRKPGRQRVICSLLAFFILIGGFLNNPMTTYATLEDLEAEAEARKSLPVQSNDIENWPVGPAVSAESAILMDANTGVILYAKNIHKKLYPASTTKLLTCLIAMEQGNLDDMVNFSHEAVFTVPVGGSNMGMDEGESITLEEALYGILVGSANEVANAVGEYVSGSIEDFVAEMNKRAEELGCTDSHFMNTNGLHDDDHYTSAYDLALISSSFFQNEMLCKIGNTARYHFEPTATQPDDFYKNNKHRIINGEIPYDGVLGGKTGYTDEARQTLVTCAEQNGMKLICVVFKEESPSQFTDTVELFDYGFNNFQVMNISENEDRYQMEVSGFLQTGNDIFGNSKPILSIDSDSYVIIPNTIDFSDMDSSIDYSVSNDNCIAQIKYSYHDTYVGNAFLELATDNTSTYDFDTNIETTDVSVEKTELESSQDNTIFINVKKVLTGILIFAVTLILLFIIRAIIMNNNNARRRKNRMKRKQNRRERIRSSFDDFDF
ncbi:MAG: D-alanyl-D-alanine carboxypeptidase [Lachnospiraceae bacterium]|nr:D-alanyl-D-alanine carboxypeptidase [Lachnospiraceae bacterium]